MCTLDLDQFHGVIGSMLHISEIDIADSVDPDGIDNFVSNEFWAIHSTYNIVLEASLGAAIFSREIFIDIPFLAYHTLKWQTRVVLIK